MPFATGYPSDILTPRAIVQQGNYALIPKDNLCKSVIPCMEDCLVSVLASPELGANFAFYKVEVPAGKGTSAPWAKGEGIESFAFVLEGEGELRAAGQSFDAPMGAYLYAPPGQGMEFSNTGEMDMTLLLVRQRYRPLEGTPEPKLHFNLLSNLEAKNLADVDNVWRHKLLPNDMSMDLDVMILTFEPGSAHTYAEVHQQEHGMYILEGEGAYYLGDSWTITKKDDFIWMGPYCPQVAYAVGRSNFSYIFTKDCNRDIEL